MKLVILIPCFNEEKTLPLVIKSIPKKIPDVDEIEVLIVDDGSTDATSKIAKKLNCVVIKNLKNIGLGQTFKKGTELALERGANILVNLDGDNQYNAQDIPKLIKPIIDNKAEIVIGDRGTNKIKHFSLTKKFFQYLGSLTVRVIASSNVKDTVSGFRAYSRESLLRLNVTCRFSYVLDTIIQANSKNLAIVNTKIRTNGPTRKSRLAKNMFHHILRSSFDLLRVYCIYWPLKFFFSLGFISSLLGTSLILRFGYYYMIGNGSGHIQSLIIASILVFMGITLFSLGIIAEIVRTNRVLIEEQLYFQKKLNLKNE